MRIDIDEDDELEEIRRRKIEEMMKSGGAEQSKVSVSIIIYRTPTCPYCHMAAEYLRSKGIPFKEIDVSKDPVAAREMVMKSSQMGVPVIDINGQIIVGFNRPAIDMALAKIRR